MPNNENASVSGGPSYLYRPGGHALPHINNLIIFPGEWLTPQTDCQERTLVLQGLKAEVVRVILSGAWTNPTPPKRATCP